MGEVEVEVEMLLYVWIQLIVRGPALAYPSTLVIISPGIAYSLQVGLSTLESTGKVTLTTPRDRICADAAGNNYQRSPNSTIVVRFSMYSCLRNLLCILF